MILKRLIRPVLLSLVTTILIISFLIALGIYNNNIDTAPASRDALKKALDSSVAWLQQNRLSIISDHNSALWWMIKEAASISDDAGLKKIYTDYKYSFLDLTPNNIWTPYFDDHYTPVIDDISRFDSLHEYQLFFVYALSCNEELGSEQVIRNQLAPDYCSNHFLHPRCVTHQQMAVRFLNRRRCGDHEDLAEALLDIIEQEITVDFRVTDSYLQRALMLTDSNRPLKPVWISKILKAQMDDGGWADFYTLIELGDLRIGTTSTRPSASPKPSDFHATAQALWLIAMLLDESRVP